MKKPVVLAVLLLSLAPAAASACSCIDEDLTPNGGMERSTYTFVGRVVAVEPVPHAQGFDENRIRFRVSRTFKGASMDEIEVWSAASGATCGYQFQVGIDYVVYAHGPEDRPDISLCSLTGPASDPRSGLKELENGS